MGRPHRVDQTVVHEGLGSWSHPVHFVVFLPVRPILKLNEANMPPTRAPAAPMADDLERSLVHGMGGKSVR